MNSQDGFLDSRKVRARPTLRDLEFQKRSAASQNEKGVSLFIEHPVTNQITHHEGLSCSEWRDAIKMVGNVAAVCTIPARSMDSNRCRHCFNEIETLTHVLGSCPHANVIRKSGVQVRSDIIYKSTQVMAFADDIVIIGRSLKYVEEAFLALEKSVKEMGMVIEGKIKYMVATSGNSGGKADSIQMENYKFERVDKFKYLRFLVTNDNNKSKKISNRMVCGNRAYFGLKKYFKSHALTQKTKTTLYKTLVRSTLIYASGTWTIYKNEERRLDIFERKIL
ncbi:hypothetical protein ANN_26807 [Periplaneta americana]|uniref:Reverse transcriptase n=1 Tax=Periplaneta americana TaxID=6978 RepID=A0ABQ8RZ93_PERAM|nr:hypothetical protein ANN_26807 [Periplaneta americana]